jgi:hypothetical protein
MFVRVERLSDPLRKDVQADAECVVINTFKTDGTDECNITIEVDRDNDPVNPEVRIMVDNECVWSGLGYE